MRADLRFRRVAAPLADAAPALHARPRLGTRPSGGSGRDAQVMEHGRGGRPRGGRGEPARARPHRLLFVGIRRAADVVPHPDVARTPTSPGTSTPGATMPSNQGSQPSIDPGLTGMVKQAVADLATRLDVVQGAISV